MLSTILVLLSVVSYQGNVGRISAIQGEAKVLSYGSTSWEYATINSIVEEGDMIKTEDNSRLEFEFGDGNVVTLGQLSKIELNKFSDNDVEFRVDRGIVRAMTKDINMTITAGNNDVDVSKYSTVRVDYGSIVNLKVLRGEIHLHGEVVRAGETAEIKDNGNIIINRNVYRDSFDDWAIKYEKKYIVVREVEYVPTGIYIGVSDLSPYGTWRYVGGYGWVWTPYVNDYWRPYYYGYWRYSARFGWVWVSYERWGWLPYHYGRWAYSPGVGWFWVPGSVWSGGWVSWSYGPGWVCWTPLDPYGRPIYYVSHGRKRYKVSRTVDYNSFKNPPVRYKPPHNGRYTKPVYANPIKPPTMKDIRAKRVEQIDIRPVYVSKAAVRTSPRERGGTINTGIVKPSSGSRKTTRDMSRDRYGDSGTYNNCNNYYKSNRRKNNGRDREVVRPVQNSGERKVHIDDRSRNGNAGSGSHVRHGYNTRVQTDNREKSGGISNRRVVSNNESKHMVKRRKRNRKENDSFLEHLNKKVNNKDKTDKEGKRRKRDK